MAANKITDLEEQPVNTKEPKELKDNRLEFKALNMRKIDVPKEDLIAGIGKVFANIM